MSIYINGLKESEKIIDSSSITYTNADYFRIGSITSGNAFNGKISDVRVYDHALSPMEVKQISQGLILHYPLSDKYLEDTTNLVTGITTGGQTTVNNNVVTISGANKDTYFLINLSENIVAGTQYTFSCDAEIPSGIWYFPLGKQDNTALNFVLHNGHNVYSFVANDISWGTKRLFMDDAGGTARGTGLETKIYNFQLEKKDHETGFAGYGASRTSTIVYDTSGFCNNGIISGGVTISNDTPKYSVSTELAGTSYGTHQYLFSNDNYQKELTVSCWIKRTSSENTRRYISNSWVALYLYSNFDPRISWRNSTGTSDVLNTWAPGGAIPINTWTHICFTIKDGIVKYYKNGIHVSTSDRTQYGTLIHGSLSNGFGGESLTSNNWIGGLSDFRFYCTALSTEDILALYKNSVYIDNEGNLYGTELREV